MKDDDFKLLRGFADIQTDGRTLVIVDSFLQLKMFYLRLKPSGQRVNCTRLT